MKFTVLSSICSRCLCEAYALACENEVWCMRQNEMVF